MLYGEPKNQAPFTRRVVNHAKKAVRKVLPVPFTMYDSVTVTEIPPHAEAVAGYVGGLYPTFTKLVEGFPRAHRLSIAVNAGQNADCLDIEKGDAVPSEAPAWVKRQIARGARRPAVYCSVSDAVVVQQTLKASGVTRDKYRLWTAHYTYRPHRCDAKCGFGFRDRADATQYSDHALGRNLDASLCAHTFFG